MKDMDAMTLAVIRDRMRTGRKPPRDIVLAFLADEEAGGVYGARWLVDNHPELFEGCTEAIGEVGGFSYEISDDLRLYAIQTAEKGIAWMRLTVAGRAGHGSMVARRQRRDGAVRGGRAARAAQVPGPADLDRSAAFLEELTDAAGRAARRRRPREGGQPARRSRPRRRRDAAPHRRTPPSSTPATRSTSFPATASAVRRRPLPARGRGRIRADAGRDPRAGRQARVDQLRPRRWRRPSTAQLVDAMSAALKAEDRGARPVPYMLSGGTDAKSFARLGIRCFGFAPLRLPRDLDFTAMFHGVDERVPVERAAVRRARTRPIPRRVLRARRWQARRQVRAASASRAARRSRLAPDNRRAPVEDSETNKYHRRVEDIDPARTDPAAMIEHHEPLRERPSPYTVEGYIQGFRDLSEAAITGPGEPSGGRAPGSMVLSLLAADSCSPASASWPGFLHWL